MKDELETAVSADATNVSGAASAEANASEAAGEEKATPSVEDRLAKLESDYAALLEVCDRHGINLPTAGSGASKQSAPAAAGLGDTGSASVSPKPRRTRQIKGTA